MTSRLRYANTSVSIRGLKKCPARRRNTRLAILNAGRHIETEWMDFELNQRRGCLLIDQVPRREIKKSTVTRTRKICLRSR